jgi:pilus assembly protein CpaC
MKRNLLNTIAINSVTLSVFMTANTAFSEDLSLKKGKSQTLSFETEVVKVQIESPGVVSVSPSEDKKSLRITGKASGGTGVKVTLRNGETQRIAVDVESNPMRSGVPERLDPANIVEAVNNVLDRNGISTIKAKALGKMVMLVGLARDEKDRELTMKLAHMIDPNIIDAIEDSQYSASPSVVVDVMFLEHSNRGDLSFGLNAYDQGGRNPMAAAKTKSWSGEVGNQAINWSVAPLSTMLTLIQSKGQSKVLSNPKLVVRSGNEAKFHSGGSVYLTRTETKDGEQKTTLFDIPYGMQLSVRPKVDALGQIDIVLSTEVSEFSSQIEGQLPGKTVSKTDTSVTLKNGNSVLLSGFKNTKERKVTTRVPFLADIPIIGELFKNRKFEHDKRDMLVLLTARKHEIGDDQVQQYESMVNFQSKSKSFTELEKNSTDNTSFSIFD